MTTNLNIDSIRQRAAKFAKAHNQLNIAVDSTYGYKGSKDYAARVAFLFERYQALLEN
jgi:hypothetical protein